VTIQLAAGAFLWVVHGHHASILHRYGDYHCQKLPENLLSENCRSLQKSKRSAKKIDGQAKFKI